MNKKDLVSKIKDLFIVRESDGTYHLFGKYLITPVNESYKITVQDENINYTFYSLKHAVTWCVFDKNRKYKELKRVLELDSDIISLEAAIVNHERLLLKSEGENKYIYQAKLYEEKLKKRKLLEEINQFAALSKYMQTRKFQENQGI